MKAVGVGHSCLDRICTVENYPREDDSTHITSISIQGGGAVATALVALSRLGVPSSFIGNGGFDRVTDQIEELFHSDGVDTSCLMRRKDAHGLESFVMVNRENGSRTKFPERDTNPPIEWNEALEKEIASADVLHLDGTGWENAVKAVEIAKRHGVTVSLDGCSMQKDNEKNRILASSSDILIMNRKYPLRVSGKESYEEALIEMATWGPKIVIATLGEKGSLAVVDGVVKAYPAFTSLPVVDTTGCGDVFHGAFLSALLKGKDTEEAIFFASAASALKATEKGGRKGIPTWERVTEFLENSWKQQKGETI